MVKHVCPCSLGTAWAFFIGKCGPVSVLLAVSN